MQIGVISDIHGNLPALEAVLSDMPDVDALVCAGDVVGYNPWPAECLEIVRQRKVPTVQGNHDREVARGGGFGFNSMASAGVEYAREALDAAALSWLGDLPTHRSEIRDRIRLVHGHPDDPDRYTYPREFSSEMVADIEADVLVLGHTHVQSHRAFEDGVVMNPGSVGQPRDGDPRAAYALVELEDRGDAETPSEVVAVTENRVEYDIESVIAAIDDVGLPKRIGTRLKEGR